MTVQEARRRPWRTTLALAGGAALVCFTVWSLVAHVPQISHLAPASRRALYERTLSDLELCNGPEGPMVAAHCDQQAEFILNFEECDGACKGLSAKWRQVLPTK